MASITSWWRLESRPADVPLETSLEARVHDPLWLLARQWQTGELQGEDAGSPVSAGLRAECSELTAYHLGALPRRGSVAGLPYDAADAPLEAVVEREAVRGRPAVPDAAGGVGRSDLRLAAEAGLHFMRVVEAAGHQDIAAAAVRDFPITAPIAAERAVWDASSLRFVEVMAGRAPNGDALYVALDAAIRPPGPGTVDHVFPGAPQSVSAVAEAWLLWYEHLFEQPADSTTAWVAERMEHQFSVAAGSPDGEVVLRASEYADGDLDWYAFDWAVGASLQASDRTTVLAANVLPAPVRFRGMPADRWWEFEDAAVDFGGVESAPNELARLLLVEFALVYGNDWFLIPLDLPAGRLCTIDAVSVTDTFGVVADVHPAGGSDTAPWRMFELSAEAAPPARARRPGMLIPPSLVSSLSSAPVEEVLLVRDEMANMAWAVERTIEGVANRPVQRRELEAEVRERAGVVPPPAPTGDAVRYSLATGVPTYWVPLVPVRAGGDNIRLARGTMLSAAGAPPNGAIGRLLEPWHALLLFEEEVPREGGHVTRAWQSARWVDGSTAVWMARRKHVGRGEGSSGLRFDHIDPV